MDAAQRGGRAMSPVSTAFSLLVIAALLAWAAIEFKGYFGRWPWEGDK